LEATLIRWLPCEVVARAIVEDLSACIGVYVRNIVSDCDIIVSNMNELELGASSKRSHLRALLCTYV
jgi:hypothetical protein